MAIRLVSADEVEALICKYVNGTVQKTLVLEIIKLNGCLSTDEQLVEVLGNADVYFDD
ncbi:hypothetical protein OBV_p-00650 (plasmid) [Oscillibacter valericigenes Sjm18-20]|nr:hypothetical protein OBV_p-00650 [Oscillibacter valericigenes Sjm18-20]